MQVAGSVLDDDINHVAATESLQDPLRPCGRREGSYSSHGRGGMNCLFVWLVTKLRFAFVARYFRHIN